LISSFSQYLNIKQKRESFGQLQNSIGFELSKWSFESAFKRDPSLMELLTNKILSIAEEFESELHIAATNAPPTPSVGRSGSLSKLIPPTTVNSPSVTTGHITTRKQPFGTSSFSSVVSAVAALHNESNHAAALRVHRLVIDMLDICLSHLSDRYKPHRLPLHSPILTTCLPLHPTNRNTREAGRLFISLGRALFAYISRSNSKVRVIRIKSLNHET